MDTVDRIFELLDETNMEQQVFAANVGVSEDTASNWRRRKSASYSKYIPQIAEILNTTSEYLLTGHGPKHRNVPESDTLSEEETAIISAYRQTDERNRQIVRLTLGLKG